MYGVCVCGVGGCNSLVVCMLGCWCISAFARFKSAVQAKWSGKAYKHTQKEIDRKKERKNEKKEKTSRELKLSKAQQICAN